MVALPLAGRSIAVSWRSGWSVRTSRSIATSSAWAFHAERLSLPRSATCGTVCSPSRSTDRPPRAVTLSPIRRGDGGRGGQFPVLFPGGLFPTADGAIFRRKKFSKNSRVEGEARRAARSRQDSTGGALGCSPGPTPARSVGHCRPRRRRVACSAPHRAPGRPSAPPGTPSAEFDGGGGARLHVHALIGPPAPSSARSPPPPRSCPTTKRSPTTRRRSGRALRRRWASASAPASPFEARTPWCSR